MPDIKYVRTYDRADFLQLMGTIAYAMAPRHLLNPENPPVIAIYGIHGSGKSLAAEGLLKGWMDEFSNGDIITIPRDNKMFLEKKPMDAVNTVWRTSTVDGLPITFAFNSDPLPQKADYEETLADIFTKKTKPNLLIMSNVDRGHYYNVPGSPVWMEINMNALPLGGGVFHRDIHVTVFNDALLDDPQFNVYWQRLEDLFTNDPARERALLRPAMQLRALPPLPGKTPT